MKVYQTLMREACEEYIIQKSRFIGHAVPVQTEEAALAFLEEVRREHKSANHHCYAYIIGDNAGIMRYSDDGEPGGTAGLPMMEVLKARGVVNCAAVVTRYFGGILLGAGGLVRAYSHTCSLAVKAAGICEKIPSFRWELEVGYPLWDKVQHTLRSLPVIPGTPMFTTAVRFSLLCRQCDADWVREELLRVTDGRIIFLQTEELYSAWEIDEAGED